MARAGAGVIGVPSNADGVLEKEKEGARETYRQTALPLVVKL